MKAPLLFDSRDLAKYGWTVQKAIRFALDHLKRQENGTKIEDAITALVAQKKAEGASTRYCNDIKNRLAKLSAVHAGKIIATITTEDLDGFLNALVVAPGTKNTFRRDIRTLLELCRKEELGISQNSKGDRQDEGGFHGTGNPHARGGRRAAIA
jgi:hypothetical protein